MSNKGMPSLLALLGLVAVAGFQNRDKLGDLIQGARNPAPAGDGPTPGASASGSGGLLDEIGRTFGSGSGTSGNSLKEGLDSLLDRFRTNGQGDKAESWVSAEANKDLDDGDLETAIGDDTIEELVRRTGLSRSDLVERLKAALPETVNRLTPDGRLPS